MTQNKTTVVVMIGFTIAVIMAFVAGFEYQSISTDDLKEKYGVLKIENEGTNNLLTLEDTQVLNLDPYAYLYCLQHEKIDNVTQSVNYSRESFPSNDWFYGDKKINCFMQSQVSNDTLIRFNQNVNILKNGLGNDLFQGALNKIQKVGSDSQ